MILNQDDENKESDLISGFTLSENNICATMMRILPNADDTHIDRELMKKHSFSINDLSKHSNNAAAIYKNHYYICFNNNFLVTNLPQNITIKRVENYLNWLLNTHIYEITPIIIPSPDLKLSNISTIKFSNHPDLQNNVQNPTSIIEDKKVFLTKNILNIVKNLFIDTQSLKDIDLEQIVHAELLIKLKKPKTMSDIEFQNTYGSLLKPISDSDNIVFCDKNGNKIKGSEILKTKTVSIELNSNNYISEQQLFIEMQRFIDEISQ